MKQGVEKFIFNGADLMFPGIKAIFPSPAALKQNDLCVVYAQNKALA